MRLICFILLLFPIGFGPVVKAQQATPSNKRPLLISVFQQSAQLPFSGDMFTVLHPGFDVGTEFYYNHNPRRQWFQTAKLGIWNHHYVQTGIQLYSEAGYRRLFWKGLGAELRIGAGYLHSIPATEYFELENGAYVAKSRFGRPQFMGSAAAGLSYTLPNQLRFSADYQFFLQMPFINKYVPMAPGTALHVGVAWPLTSP